MRQTGYFAEQAKSSGKRARTRAALMDAAVRVIAQNGIEGASVNEIAREAGVANGTFYLHFRDKDEIVSAAAIAVAARIAAEMDARMQHLEDAIDRIVCGTRTFLQILSEDPELGGAVLNAARSRRDNEPRAESYLRADIQRGIDQGVFRVPVDEYLVSSIIGVAATALAARLRGELGAEAGSRAAELQLRLLGIEPEKAKEAAWQPLEMPSQADADAHP